MTDTPNIGLKKYGTTDSANLLTGYNASMDTLDTVIKQEQDDIDTLQDSVAYITGTLTPASGWTIYFATLFKVNKLVVLQIRVALGTKPALPSGAVIGTIPEGFRPNGTIHFPFTAVKPSYSDFGEAGTMTINNSGECNIYLHGSGYSEGYVLAVWHV